MKIQGISKCFFGMSFLYCKHEFQRQTVEVYAWLSLLSLSLFLLCWSNVCFCFLLSAEWEDKKRKRLPETWRRSWERIRALGGCVQEMEVVNVLFCQPGFLIQPQFIIFSSFFEVDLIYFAFFLFHGSNLVKRRGLRVKAGWVWHKNVLGCFFGPRTEWKLKQIQPDLRKTERRNNILTFRWLFLDVRSCQVPVDQRRFTTGQVTHNALRGRRGISQCQIKWIFLLW